MYVFAVGLLLGCVSLQFFTHLPHWGWVLSAFMPLFMLLIQRKYWVVGLLPIAILLGFCWSLHIAHLKLADELPASLDRVDLIVTGRVVGIPQIAGFRAKFELQLMSLRRADGLPMPTLPIKLGVARELPHKIRLSWYRSSEKLSSGDVWQLIVRLKRANGFRNPGGFDYEGWLYRHDIDATGYVRSDHDQLVNKRLAGSRFWSLDRWRFSIAEEIRFALADSPYQGLVSALSVGDRSAVLAEQWETMTVTGTNHLMAISGLHIGIIAGLGFYLFRWLWSRFPRLLLYLPAQKSGALGSIFLALIYAGLAGFSIPTQRALMMVVIAMLGLLLQRNVAPGKLLALALVGVLFFDPLAPMDVGFWLSFSAVGLLIYGRSGRLTLSNWWWKWGRAQWVIFVGLSPLLAFYFLQLPLSAPLANMLAIPWVSLLTVPLALMGSVISLISSAVGHSILQLAALSLEGLWPVLTGLQAVFPAISLSQAPPWWAILSALVGSMLLLAPTGIPARWLGVVGYLPIIISPGPQLQHGQWLLTLLDVGQGLSAVVQTRNHLLVYDTGARFSERFDAGTAVIAPFLRHSGLPHIHKLILSHNDNDHVGAATALVHKIQPDQILSTWDVKFDDVPVSACQKGQSWQWDGVQFEVLHPPTEPYSGMRLDNNRSCVLKVSTGSHSVLLSGDIQRTVERRLVKTSAKQLQAEILVVPHHGSKSSSSEAFIDSVNPRIALFAVGYKNRYGFPKKEVLERYLQRGIEIFTTSHYGALTFKFDRKAPTILINATRVDDKRFWHSH